MIVAGIAHWIPVIVVSLLAVPLAMLAAVALVRLRVHRGDAGIASAAVEAAQYLFDLGRVSSIDDVLLNSVGAGLAALCSRRWWASGGPARHEQ